MTARRWARRALALALLPLTLGCSALPDSGPVHREHPAANATPFEPPYVDPPGPARGASRTGIVSGFLTAMQANPISTVTARTYLSDRARQTWQPGGGTIVYDAATLQERGNTVVARLSDAHELDARGSWSPEPTRTRIVRFRLVRESGQWRVQNPLDALMVRTSYFEDQFALYDLYFFDHTDRVLVPDPVYVPRGPQTATALVRGLLSGPDTRLASVLRTSLPAGATLNPSVVVTDSGVAEVPLGPEVLRLSPGELNRAMVQLAWTLRPLQGVNRVRITVEGTPVALPDGRTDLGVDEGSEFAPTGLGASRELVGIRRGRVVTVSGSSIAPVAGGLGRRGYALRSVALDRSGDRVAAVSESGTTVYAAQTAAGSPKQVDRVFTGGHDLLRPSYDVFGALWLVDRTSAGAVVRVAAAGGPRVVRFPGISGHDVTSFAVSPDGTQLVAGLADPLKPRVVVATVRRGVHGRVLGGMPARAVPVSSYDPSHELGPVADVGWRTPTLIAVLTHPSRSTSRIVYAMADGSPGDNNPPPPDPFPQAAPTLVVNSDIALPLTLLDDRGRLVRLDAAGKWDSTGATGLTAAAYAD